MLTEISRRGAAEFVDTLAYVTEQGLGITYAELDEAAEQVAARFAARGLGEGDVVALVLPSVIDYVVYFLAADRVGAVTAGLNSKLRPREIANCLEVLRPALVIVTGDLIEGVALAGLEAEVITPGTDAASIAALHRQGPSVLLPELTEDDDRPVCICFTSGSTGMPKGAWYTNRQLRRIAELDTGGAWGGGGHGISSTHFAHVGFMTKLPWLLASGRTTHLLERWSAGPVLQLIADHKMPAVTGVAPQLALMMRSPLIDTLDFSAVQAIVAGGAASPPALVHECRERFGAGYSIRYSSTESGGIGLGTALDADDEEALHTIGRPRPGVEASIRDEHGEPVADGEIGELWIQSGCIMSGYWNDPETTAETLVDGWLRTGDLAHVDDNGCYRLAGRLKEMFIRGGYNVYPMEVESVLVAHPGIAEVAVVPRPDPVMGEIGVAVVVPIDADAPPTLDDIRSFGENDLAKYKLPEDIRIIEALPRNSTEKVDRRTLAEAEASGG
ncbi:MAG: class I adenylate-forming enzyme family protein [Acidimicrobiales bacterium]|jgi:acyl-CoA synthetase (AMP-forming)/AMP-acid ligase II|nr:class I adenylate-forming enzyme family protein [Acidimicrobiales bacterium]